MQKPFRDIRLKQIFSSALLPETPENNNTVHKVLSSIDHLEINTLALFKHHEEIDNGSIPLTKCSLELIY